MESLRHQPDDDRGLRFIEQFALLLTDGGIPRMPARMFACVLAEDAGRLTAAEFSERLRVSPAAVSSAARYLVQVGLLVKGREPGARRDHYGLADDLWYEAFGQKDELLRRWQEGLADGIDLLGRDTPAGSRLEETRAFFAFMRTELPPMLERWREHRRALALDEPGAEG